MAPALGVEDVANLPDLVIEARRAATEVGFALAREQAADEVSACLAGVGRFLAVLAATCVNGRIGELGTGTGVGTAWMVGAMPRDCRLVTAEIDQARAAAAARLFASDDRVDVITGDALDNLIDRGPYDLLFADCGVRPGAVEDHAVFGRLIGALRIGGMIVMDDVTPLAARDSWSATLGPTKRGFFTDPRLVSTEVVLPDLQNSLLVGTRVRE